MGAIGEKRHGAEGDAGDDFHHHENGGEIDHETRAGFRAFMIRAEIEMVMGPGVIVRLGHLEYEYRL